MTPIVGEGNNYCQRWLILREISLGDLFKLKQKFNLMKSFS